MKSCLRALVKMGYQVISFYLKRNLCLFVRSFVCLFVFPTITQDPWTDLPSNFIEEIGIPTGMFIAFFKDS